MIKTKVLTSLEKVFPEGMQEGLEIREIAGCREETVSFQIAYLWQGTLRAYGQASLAGDRAVVQGAGVRRTELVPCEYPWPVDGDEGYLRREPGLFPDLLREISGEGFPLIPGQWRSLWVTLKLPDAAGDYNLEICLSVEGQEDLTLRLPVHVEAYRLPRADVRHTEWFHGDCLADYYRVEVFSEEHWRIMENFLAAAAARSCDTILTPLFTPPLDTAPGGERRTIQLVDVTKEGEHYSFGFEKLERWIGMCQRCGFTYFEMSHLFTQWGAKAAPKIMGTAEGKQVQLFGWGTPAAGAEYAGFLKQFLPALTGKLREWGLWDRVYFHISDEPEPEQMESYRAARQLVIKELEGFQMLDALSDHGFYKSGLIGQPVCGIDHLGPFLKERPGKLWTYYCCAQKRGVPNRFIAQHSGKNRILGVLLYRYRLDGFLHWGYNFYNSQYSLYPVDPYLHTDADGGFPAGDPFLVYPGKGGVPEESIRLMVLDEAFSDLRFLYLAEEKLGRERVEEIIRTAAGREVTVWDYPQSPEFFLKLRRRLTSALQG